MIKGTMNQMYNIGNVHQTDTKKVLTICSAGLLRSPTLADHLCKEYGYNTRACGTHDYALVPVSEALLKWADEIVCVNQDTYNALVPEAKTILENAKAMGDEVTILDIPDVFEWGNEELVTIIAEQYKEAHNV